MKSLQFAAVMMLTLFQWDAESAELGRFTNTGGGSIVMTTEKCKSNEDFMVAFATTKEGALTMGCWFWGGQEFFVVWEDGRKSAYDLDGFQPSEEFQQSLKRKGVQM